MEIKKLETFLTVYDCRNMSEASNLVFTSQSNISKQIRSLEKRLGTTLFDRTKRSITPTKAAVLLETYARETVRSYKKLQKEIDALAAREAQQLCVACVPIMSYYGLSRDASRFKKRYPDIECNIMETDTTEAVTELIEKRAHAAFMRKSSADSRLCQTLTVREDRLAVVVPCNHPLAQQSCLSLSQLANEKILLFEEQGQFEKFCLPRFRLDGFEPKITYRGNDVDMLMEFVANGLGVSLLMEQIANYAKLPNVKIIPLSETYSDPLVLARLKQHIYPASCDLLWSFMQNDWPRQAETSV